MLCCVVLCCVVCVWYLLVHREGTSKHEEHETDGPSEGQTDESCRTDRGKSSSSGTKQHTPSVWFTCGPQDPPTAPPPSSSRGPEVHHVRNQLTSRAHSITSRENLAADDDDDDDDEDDEDDEDDDDARVIHSHEAKRLSQVKGAAGC